MHAYSFSLPNYRGQAAIKTCDRETGRIKPCFSYKKTRDMKNSAIALAMRKIHNKQGHYEWKLCFLAGCLRGSNAPLNSKPGSGAAIQGGAANEILPKAKDP